MRTVRRWGLASSGIRAMRSPTRSASERLGSQNGYLSCGGWQARVRIVKSDGKSPQHGGSHFGLEPVRVHCCSAVAPPSSSSSSSIPPSMPETDGERWGRGGILRPSPPHSPPRWRPASPRRKMQREKNGFCSARRFCFCNQPPKAHATWLGYTRATGSGKGLGQRSQLWDGLHHLLRRRRAVPVNHGPEGIPQKSFYGVATLAS